MKITQVDVVRAWKDASYRNQLSAEQLATLPANPIENAREGLDAMLMGAGEKSQAQQANSSGLICTWSGECMGGQSCNPFVNIFN